MSYSLFVMWLVPLASWISMRGGESGREIHLVFLDLKVLNLHTVQLGRTHALFPFPEPLPKQHLSFWTPLQVAIKMQARSSNTANDIYVYRNQILSLRTRALALFFLPSGLSCPLSLYNPNSPMIPTAQTRPRTKQLSLRFWRSGLARSLHRLRHGR
jgi:hypothetical protein